MIRSQNHHTLGITFLLGLAVLIGLTLLAIRTMADTPVDTSLVKELIEKRTLTSKTFLRADGSYYLNTSSAPLHYLNNGKLEDIDLNMQDIGMMFINKANGFTSEVPKTADGQFTDIYQGNIINIKFNGANVKTPIFSGDGNDGYGRGWATNKAIYQEVYPGVDLEVTQTYVGVKRELIFKDGQTDNVSVQIDSPNDVPDIFSSTSPKWNFKDSKGNKVFEIQTKGNKRFFQNKNQNVITIKPDKINAEYPIRIDPTTVFTSTTNQNQLMRSDTNNLSWAGIRASAGNAIGQNQNLDFATTVGGGAFKNLRRMGTCYDTSSLGSTATITSATSSQYFVSISNDLPGQSTDAVLTVFKPASSSTIAVTDFAVARWGATSSISSLSYILEGDITINAYNRFPFTDFSNIYKTGTSCFGLMLNWDLADSPAPATTLNSNEGFMVQTTLDANGPTLGIVYTLPAAAASSNPDEMNWWFLLWNTIKNIFV